ncbi:MAG: hypothetical protein ABIO24_12265, partial [Saprospiraceae bacterium]
VFTYTLPDFDAYGVVTDVYSCDSSTTYITTTNSGRLGVTDTLNQIYKVDLATQTLTLICETPYVIYGAATPNEFLASDCSVRLDLDDDDSSTATGPDFQAAAYCGSGFVALADTDALFYSGYHVDSLRIRLLPPAPDGAAEYLSVANLPPTLTLSGANTAWLTLHNAGNAKAPDFQTAIRSVRWQDDALPVTPGSRSVEFIAFASSGHGDTARTFILVPPPRTAGRDTALLVCRDGLPFALSPLLAPGASPGGSWLPALPGNGLFDPAGAGSTTYFYILPDQECPGDTAGITVTVAPVPTFSLGPDQVFCAGESLTLGPVTGSVNWQDGTSGATYGTALPGLYWAEVADLNGCHFRDSLVLTRLEPVQQQESLNRCAGQPYVWQGAPISRDTLLCATTLGVNGCDSTYCLDLSFFYPTLAVDTTLCAGQALDWAGQSLSVSGDYPDTLFLAGCLTAVNLHLDVLPAIQYSLPATICAGESYSVGSQSFNTAGFYSIPLQSPAGCDSTVLLQLTVQQAVSSSVTAAICPGAQYDWNGTELSLPGSYTDTLATLAGCDSVVTLSLNYLPLPQPVAVDTLRFCAGETASLNVGVFAAYQWSTGSGAASLALDQPGEYAVTVNGTNGCTASATTLALLYPEIAATWETLDPLCPGGADGAVSLMGITGGEPPFLYRFNQGPWVDLPEFGQLPTGPWAVEIRDTAGCEKTFSGTLLEPDPWSVAIGNAPVLEAGSAFPIPLQTNGGGPFTYAWSPAGP